MSHLRGMLRDLRAASAGYLEACTAERAADSGWRDALSRSDDDAIAAARNRLGGAYMRRREAEAELRGQLRPEGERRP